VSPPRRRQPAHLHIPLQRSPPFQWWRPRVLYSLREQGAGAPAAPGVLRQWGLDFGFQLVPPPGPTRLRRPLRRAPLAAPPAHKEGLLVSNVLEQRVLDYSAQDNLPPEAWSLRPSSSSPPASWRGCAASVVARQG
jgi:hypothetical protein